MESLGKAEIYDTDRFAQLYYPSRNANTMHLGLAARYMTALFHGYNITYAFIGGWAVYLRGGNRTTQDVDIAVAVPSMDILKAILCRQHRIHFPAVHGQTCVQIFIDTGRSHDLDFPQVSDLAVDMDVVISGNLGTPPNLQNSTEIINPSRYTPQGSPVMVLSLFFQICAKLTAFVGRGGQSNNDYLDLEFLLASYAPQIPDLRDFLPYDQRCAFLEKFQERNPGQPARVQNMQALLGVSS